MIELTIDQRLLYKTLISGTETYNYIIHTGNLKNYAYPRLSVVRDYNATSDFQAPGIPGLPTDALDASFKASGSYQAVNAPATYGNCLTINYSGGAGQLFLEWKGTDNALGNLFYRSHRDTSTGGWSEWGKIPYYNAGTSDIGTNSALSNGTIYCVYE